MTESNYEKCHVSYRGFMEREINIARDILQKHKKPCAAAVEELCNETDLSLHESCSMIRCLWRDDKLEKLQAENARLKQDLEDQGAYDQYLRDRLNQENDLRMAAEAEKNERESNYEKLFGTPERAVRTLEKLHVDLADWCGVFDDCHDCMFGQVDDKRVTCWEPENFSLVEWLKEDS